MKALKRKANGLLNRLTDGNIELIFMDVIKMLKTCKKYRSDLFDKIGEVFFQASILFK